MIYLTIRRLASMTLFVGVVLLAAACAPTSTTDAADKAKSSSSSKLEGTYSNAEGTASIEFMAGGKAHFSLSGLGGEGTFKQVGNKVTVNMDGEQTVFTVNEDGSLTGPPDSFLSRLKKKKE